MTQIWGHITSSYHMAFLGSQEVVKEPSKVTHSVWAGTPKSPNTELPHGALSLAAASLFWVLQGFCPACMQLCPQPQICPQLPHRLLGTHLCSCIFSGTIQIPYKFLQQLWISLSASSAQGDFGALLELHFFVPMVWKVSLGKNPGWMCCSFHGLSFSQGPQSCVTWCPMSKNYCLIYSSFIVVMTGGQVWYWLLWR